MEKEILEGNKLIAEFMGGKWFKDTTTILEIPIVSPNGNYIKCQDKLKYHSSWDWLMPVVDKIESLGYNFRITSYFNEDKHKPKVYCNFYKSLTDILEENKVYSSKICAVWNTVVEFIKWYNSQPHTN